MFTEKEEEDSVFATYLPFQRVNIDDASNHKNDDTRRTRQNGCHHGYEDWEERFESFQRVRVGSAFHESSIQTGI